jgi:hypothetical protein
MEIKLDITVNDQFLAKVDVPSIEVFQANSELVTNFNVREDGLTLY